MWTSADAWRRFKDPIWNCGLSTFKVKDQEGKEDSVDSASYICLCYLGFRVAFLGTPKASEFYSYVRQSFWRAKFPARNFAALLLNHSRGSPFAAEAWAEHDLLISLGCTPWGFYKRLMLGLLRFCRVGWRGGEDWLSIEYRELQSDLRVLTLASTWIWKWRIHPRWWARHEFFAAMNTFYILLLDFWSTMLATLLRKCSTMWKADYVVVWCLFWCKTSTKLILWLSTDFLWAPFKLWYASLPEVERIEAPMTTSQKQAMTQNVTMFTLDAFNFKNQTLIHLESSKSFVILEIAWPKWRKWWQEGSSQSCSKVEKFSGLWMPVFICLLFGLASSWEAFVSSCLPGDITQLIVNGLSLKFSNSTSEGWLGWSTCKP